MSSHKGTRWSAAALARRARHAPFDRRWWKGNGNELWLARFAEDVEKLAPAAPLSERVRELFAVKTDERTGDPTTRTCCEAYRSDHGKALTAKTVEHRVRALLDKRRAREAARVAVLARFASQVPVDLLPTTATDGGFDGEG